jgi:uncharacterized protein YbjT (DUF2867 family)
VNTRAVHTVLVLGATGFIGSYVSRALQRAGFDVVQGVRSKGRASGCRSVEIDYRRDDHAEHWLPALRGIDAVVNAVGILRESGDVTFDAVHVKAPVALFEACVQAGVEKIIQISALGADADARSRYHITKKRADDALAALPVRWTILQPRSEWRTWPSMPRARKRRCRLYSGVTTASGLRSACRRSSRSSRSSTSWS